MGKSKKNKKNEFTVFYSMKRAKKLTGTAKTGRRAMFFS
jgi:hypothetical protein